MSDVDTNKAMEDMIRWNMSMQRGNLGLTGISKDDAALFLRDADVDASDVTSMGVSSTVKNVLNSISNTMKSRAKSTSQQLHSLDNLRGHSQLMRHSALVSNDIYANVSSALEVPDIFAKGSLFQFDSINADESSQHVETSPISIVNEDGHAQGTVKIPDTQAQQLAEVEQDCRDSYMKAYKREMKNVSNMAVKQPVPRKKKVRRQRVKASEKNQPPADNIPANAKQQTIAVDSKEKKGKLDHGKSKMQKGRRLEGVQKKKGMLELSSQQLDNDLSGSSSESERDLYFAEREATVIPKTAVVTAATAPGTAASVIVHNINLVQKEEVDTKVYSVHPMAQEVSDRKQKPLSKKNARQNINTNIDDVVEVNQLRKFSLIQPPERFHEAVAGREVPVQPTPAESTVINIDAVHEHANNKVDSIHSNHVAPTVPVAPVYAEAQDKSIVSELMESINLRESINDNIKIIGIENIRKSQRRLRRTMTAIDQAIQRNMSMISSGTKSSNLLNIVPNSREHTSDPSRFPISASPREASAGSRNQDHQDIEVKSIDGTLTMADLQPTHNVNKIVLTPPQPSQPSQPSQQQQQQVEISKSSDHNYSNNIEDTSTQFTIADASADYVDQTESYKQSVSFSTKIITNDTMVSGLIDEPVEPSRKRPKKIDAASLNHSTVDSYFKRELYDEVYGSYKLRNFLTAGTGLTPEEIRRKYGVPVMNAKKVRDVKLENIPVDHTLLPRDHSTGRIIVPELDRAIGEGVVYAYPSGGEPYITSVKVAFIPNKPPRPKRQQPTGHGANLEDSQLFINKQSERIQRTIQKNNLTINEDKFLYTNKYGSQSANIFKSFSELSFEYFHGLQMAKLVEDRPDGKRSSGAMLWHLYGASQSDRITSSGYCITQLSQGWAKFSLYGNSSVKEGELTEYTTCQYESVTIPRGIKFFLSTFLITECYFLCCIANV